VKTISIFIVALTFVGSMSSASAPERGVRTVPSVDLHRYLGKWFEVASIPQSFQKQCTGNTTADYSAAKGNLISVVNSCDTKSGKRSVAEGRAKVSDVKTNAKLKVTFVKFVNWIFAFGGKYWILDLDADYTYALVGEPTRHFAWVLSRSPVVTTEQMLGFEKTFRAQGYDTCKILTSIQTDGTFSKRMPLCKLK
jgi:apolipoprotein D and lipocalin family protein